MTKRTKTPAGPRPVGQITFTAFDDGTVMVAGLPSDHNVALHVISTALMNVATQFVNMAIIGEYPPKKISPIVSPTTAQVVGIGKPRA